MSTEWVGYAPLAGGKGYAQTPLGQIHYRDVGPRGGTPILLLHQAFMSLIQYAEIQNALAARGVRSVAVDTPGHGSSDPPPHQPTLQEFADNLAPILDHFGIDKAVVAGHHSGALMATAFAANHADRVAGVILHGAVMLSPEELTARQSAKPYDRTPRADGRQLSDWFRPFPGDTPGDAATERARTWMLLSMMLMAGDHGHHAVYRYMDFATDAQRIKAPTLHLYDGADPIRHMDERMHELRPDFDYVQFSPNGSMEMMNQPGRWADLAAAFVEKVDG